MTGMLQAHRALRAAGGVAVVAALLFLPAAAGHAAPAVTRSETISRTHLVDGSDVLVDRRNFKVTVDQTTNLRDRQGIDVHWSGGHPTGGLVADVNSGRAADQEYPVVIMECRGIDSPSVPRSQRLSQSTCWTQTPQERFQSDLSFGFPAFRMDRYATVADRAMTVGQPSPIPPACISAVGVQHWIPFKGADGTVYPGGPDGCAGIPPEAVTYEGQLQPGNTTYAATDKTGHGSATFVIQTADTNASLGCSDRVACSLVVIPIEGLSCDSAGARLPADQRPEADIVDIINQRCAATGRYQPGELSPGFPNQEDLAVSGNLWWSASNWRNRIAIPLTFAQPANVCALNGKNDGTPTYIYGSELMSQATQQWNPAFCLNPKLFQVQHVKTGEPEAKNLLNVGSIEAAFVSNPPLAKYQRPVVHAPTALTGFAVTYDIDDSTSHPYTSLKLTPRLLAKLLTESYPGPAAGLYPALDGNPSDMGKDPEFQALNPGVQPPGYNRESASAILALSSDSDVMYALTSYIWSDPEARAWLEGKPDPWGMKVNSHYDPSNGEISYPTQSWPLLDTFLPQFANNPCLDASPIPYLPLLAAPTSSLATISLDMQFNIANSQTKCANAGTLGQKLAAVGRENPGQRFILGVTSLADADRFGLKSAALQTHVDASAPAEFSDATGRTFVEPTTASLRATAALLKPEKQSGTWPIPYSDFHSDAAASGAYPGTMLVSTDVPTTGLAKQEAQHYATFLRFAAGPGQTAGFGNGDLPPGYLPITSSNGLGALAHYTELAADAVAAQNGRTPSVIPSEQRQGGTGNDHPPSGTHPSSAHPTERTSAIATEPPAVAPEAVSTSTAASSSPSPSASLSSSGPVSAQPVAETLPTPGVDVPWAAVILPVVALLALIGAVAAAVVWLRGSRQGAP